MAHSTRWLGYRCLVPVGSRARRVHPAPGPDLRLVACAAAAMVLLAAATLVAVSAGAPAAAVLPLAALAVLVRPALVLHARRARRIARAGVRVPGRRPVVTAGHQN